MSRMKVYYGWSRIGNVRKNVPLKTEIFGEDFFKNYMAALDNKIETLKKEFDEL